MGHGTYSSLCSTAKNGIKNYARADVDATAYFVSASPTEIFKEKSINNAMDPHGVTIRESRDSIEHPNSLAIMLALDVTGSMGSVPHHIVKEGLPNIMGSIIDKGIKDPQILFLGIGDHACGDKAPLQVGQFESSDELLDKWLTSIYLEGGGGAGDGESYMLAWYFAGLHTSLDCLEKRKQKGFLFTIGDEPVLKDIDKSSLKRIMGNGQYQNYDSSELLDLAREKYHVFHIHIKQTSSGSRQFVMDGWKQMLGDNLIVADKQEEVSKIIEEVISKTLKIKDSKKTTPNEMIL